MNSEQEFNTIIKNSIIDLGGWATKIADPSGSSAKMASPNAFDGFGVYPDGTPLYWEAKFMKTFESFNLKFIMDHQEKNLMDIKKLNPKAKCLIILGVKIPRKNRVYVWPIEEISPRRTSGENYLKKHLEVLPYYLIKGDLIDWDNPILPF